MTFREQAQALLRKGGMSAREARSTLDQSTLEIVELLRVSEFKNGFGLSGPVGCGKTGAIAGLMLDAVTIEIQDGFLSTGPVSLPSGGYRWPALPVQWANWPEVVNRLRVTSTSESGVQDAAEIVDRLAGASRLVLDDLGAERIRGDYAADWAISQLDLILDRRYGEGLPVWYTTSLSMSEFILRYGRRMVERLVAENPLLLVPKIDSRRLAPRT